MKSKAEEIKQFKNFLGRIEKDGYLDIMFGKLLSWVEGQITDDMGMDINDIIQGFWDMSSEVKQLREKLEVQIELKEDFQKDYEVVQDKLLRALAEKERFEAELRKAVDDYEYVQRRVAEAQEVIGTQMNEIGQLKAKNNSTDNRNEKLQAEIVRLKGILFDYFEEVQELKEKLGIDQS